MMRPYSIDATAGFPRTPVLDNFDRPNGKIDSGWSGNVGQRTSSRAKLRKCAGQATSSGVPRRFGPNQEAYFTFTNVSSVCSQSQALVLKHTGGAPTGYAALVD